MKPRNIIFFGLYIVMILPKEIYNINTSTTTQIISNAILSFYTESQTYRLPLRIAESVINAKKNDL